MKTFFDTSVLVAAVSARHVHHAPSLAAYVAAGKGQSYCAAHSLAEVYSTLTRIPGQQRLDCNQALLIVENIRGRFTTVALEADEYYSAIAAAAAEGVSGGTLYDALIAYCALKINAATIYTWNIEHFRRCGAEVEKRMRTP